jgi:hypothetical protein
MIKILDKEIPNLITELTVEQFEQITDLGSDSNLDPIEKHLKIFEYLGIPEKDFNDMEVEDFIKIVQEFNSHPHLEYPTIDTLEHEGYTYKAEMKMTVRDTKLIEKYSLAKEKGYVSKILAVFFKREDLGPVEHYTDAHLKHKAKFLAKQPAGLAIPYITFISEKIKQQAPKQLEGGNSGGVDGDSQD